MKILALILGVVMTYGIGGAMDKEHSIEVEQTRAYYKSEQEIEHVREPQTNVYVEKEIIDVNNEGRIIDKWEFNDKSILIKDNGVFTFLPQNDESRKVVVYNEEDAETVVKSYIEYYGLIGEHSKHNFDIDKYLLSKGHNPTNPSYDGCDGCKEIYGER